MDRNGLLLAVKSDKVQHKTLNIEHCYSFLVCHHPSNTPISLFHIDGPNYYVPANLSQLNVNVLTLAVRQTGAHIQVFNFQAGTLHSVIDSHGARLRRPTGQTETKELSPLDFLTHRISAF